MTTKNTEVCKHPEQPHTVWYWVEDPYEPVPMPYAAYRNNRQDAVDLVNTWIQDPPIYMRWIKVFLTENESYKCFHWDNPTELPPPLQPPKIVAQEHTSKRTLAPRELQALITLIAVIITLVAANIAFFLLS